MSDRIPTLADVCNAIAEGRIAAAIDGSMYHVNAYELRRYLNKFRALPSVSSLLDSNSSSSSGSREWSMPMRTTLA